MHCDICGEERHGTTVSNQEFKTAVFSKGFNPFSLGLVSSGTRSQWSASTEWGSSNAYENWLNFVRSNQSNWYICSDCARYLFRHLDRKFQPGFTGYALGEYAKKAGVIVALLLCPIVGLIPLWATDFFSKKTRVILTVMHLLIHSIYFYVRILNGPAQQT